MNKQQLQLFKEAQSIGNDNYHKWVDAEKEFLTELLKDYVLYLIKRGHEYFNIHFNSNDNKLNKNKYQEIESLWWNYVNYHISWNSVNYHISQSVSTSGSYEIPLDDFLDDDLKPYFEQLSLTRKSYYEDDIWKRNTPGKFILRGKIILNKNSKSSTNDTINLN